ncbi:hypothetical protein B0H17DRAFT_1132065 [Mycena rosella]|uniref:Uncharacterized protein n=1 Tax=Mycena rosella TaxID=1033263 RepID=A0AAD7DM03_MYCRO|nr:hypothetical protein B0H17DRAFT_1132065 [Mycena rosella]
MLTRPPASPNAGDKTRRRAQFQPDPHKRESQIFRYDRHHKSGIPKEFEVEVDQRLWAKHTERYNKPTNPVAGPDTSIITGPGTSKDAWSTRFSPSISAPVRGRGVCDDSVDPPGCQRRKGRPVCRVPTEAQGSPPHARGAAV